MAHEDPRTSPEAYMDYLAEREDMQHILANIVDIIEQVITGLAELGQAGPSTYGLRKAALLQNLVLEPIKRRQYAQAQDGLYEFLSDDLMLRIMELLINHASPGLDLLADMTDSYDV